MPLAELHRRRAALAARVEAANADLVALLEERDALSMQRDALAVDVQDLRDLAERMGAEKAATTARQQKGGGRKGEAGAAAEVQ